MKPKGKSTEILEKELKDYANLDGYFMENEEELAEDSLTAQLQSLLEARGMEHDPGAGCAGEQSQ